MALRKPSTTRSPRAGDQGPRPRTLLAQGARTPHVRYLARRNAIQLRLGPTRNNQHVGVDWADDFEFSRLDWTDLGP